MWLLLSTLLCFAEANSELVGHWLFNEGAGDTLHDSSGKGNHGVISGLQWSGSMGLIFDGNGGKVTVPYSPTLSSPVWTVTAWVYPTDKASFRTVLAKTDSVDNKRVNYYIQLQPDKTVQSGFTDGYWRACNSTASLQENQQYFLASTFDGQFLKLYVDNQEVAKANLGAFTPNTGQYPLLIGELGGFSNQDFIGTISEVRVYNNALDSSQIMALYKPVTPCNVAFLKTATGSVMTGTRHPFYAIDADSTTGWRAGAYAPQWIKVDFGHEFAVDSISFKIPQSPAGRSVHEITAYNNNGDSTLVYVFDTVITINGEWISHTFNPPISNVRQMRLETTISPSWCGVDAFEVFSPNCGDTLTAVESAFPAVKNAGITVFPNPFKGSLTIRLPRKAKEAVFSVYNLKGQRIFTQRSTGNVIWNAKGQTPGVYVLRVKTDGGAFQERIVLIK